MISNIHREKGATVVEIEGRFDAIAAPQIKAELHKLIDDGSTRLVLNLEKIDFIDSAGLGVLVSCLRRTAAQSGDLRLADVPPFCRSIFELTRLTRVFDVTETTEHAVEAAARDEDG